MQFLLPKRKILELGTLYADNLGKCIASPAVLMKMLGLKDPELPEIGNLTEAQMKNIASNLIHQKGFGLVKLREYVSNEQKKYFETGNINPEWRNVFRNVCISDTLVLTRRLNQLKEYDKAHECAYSERILWNFLCDMNTLMKKGYCISGTPSQIDNLLCVKANLLPKGFTFKDGSSIFPLERFEEYLQKILPGNNLVFIK